MSEQTPTPPTIDDILGVAERAQIYADMIRNVARIATTIRLDQLANGRADDDLIPLAEGEVQLNGKPRTYGDHGKRAQQAIDDLYQQAIDAGLRANLDELLKA